MLRASVIFLIILFVSGCSGEKSAAIIAENTPAVSLLAPVDVHTPMAQEMVVDDNQTATIVPTVTQTLSAMKEPKVNQAFDTGLTPEPTATTSDDRFNAVADELAKAVPPPREDARLAAAFNGLNQGSISTNAPLFMEPLVPGQQQTFTVLDVVNNTYSEIEARLYAVGDHAYFWFETEPYGLEPDEDILFEVVSVFDEIYEGVKAVFGSENSPGIDGDPRLHVLHASPQTICGVEGDAGCGTAGFVSSPDLLPAVLNPQSNEREMFIMNDRQFGTDFYLGVLAHEFRHLIEFNYDLSDTDWEKEGSAVLASELVGLPSGGIERANMFLREPDQQLNSWTETGKGIYYGQAYLFNQYLYDRLGASLYREFAVSPLPGFVALDDLAKRHGLNQTGQSLWLDWLAALVLHDNKQAAEKFKFNVEGLETAALQPLDTWPAEISGNVHQFAADYYELPLGTTNLAFAGDSIVSLLAGQEPTNEVFWMAQRANYSNPRLTRSIDLREVETATLAYDVYADIEQAYDFAYVSVSLDGGNKWIPLEAPNMAGLNLEDDPSGSALADFFYTGREQTWQHEVVDLTSYVGQEILLRFEMVTDPILTYSGMAIDNISVPEIGYFDDGLAEGWTAEGFSLVTSSLPQTWHLQVVTFPDGSPTVTEVPVSEDSESTFVVSGEMGQQRPILIIAASAPMTLEPVSYELRLDN